MTKYVVDKLTCEVEKRGAYVDCFKIEDADKQGVSLAGYDALIIAYPTHSMNAPKIVVNFAKRLHKSNNINTFIIHTCSVDDASNYGSSDLLIKKLNKKGYRVIYNTLVEMPSNFSNKYTEKQVVRALAKANEAAAAIAQDITELKSNLEDTERSRLSKIITSLARIEWFGARFIGKFFYAKNHCKSCGACVANCPNKNIVKNKKTVGFKWSCGMCMRCIYQCAENAVGVRRPFGFVRFDKWYDTEMFK
jgi:ferredoxin